MNTLEHIVINTSEISLTMSCEDIYEALRFCAIEKKCTRCPLFSITDCDAVLMPAVFEMVKRQKAEIEKLREVNISICETGGRLLHERKTIRNATIKEFVEKTDKIITEIYNKFIFGYDLEDEAREAIMDFSADISRGIDNLVKETTEEKE